MIPKTGAISLNDFRKTHGILATGGNPEFPSGSFALSSIYTQNMMAISPYSATQNMNAKRGAVAGLNRNKNSASTSYYYPGRTNVYKGNPSGMTAIEYEVRSEGTDSVNLSDPTGQHIRCLLQGKNGTGGAAGTNSTIHFAVCFYLDQSASVSLKFNYRFIYAGSGPSTDPSPPVGGARQGMAVAVVEYADTWGGSSSSVVTIDKFTTVPTSVKAYSKSFSLSSARPYKLISFQTNNHGHPSTQPNDNFRGYWGKIEIKG